MSLAERVIRFDRRCRAAAERYGTSHAALVARLLRVYAERGLRPDEALASGLGAPGLPADARRACISKDELLRIQDRLNPPARAVMTDDKSVFYPLCEGLGIPVPRSYAVVARDGRGFARGGAPIAGREAWARCFDASLPDEVVIKPAVSAYGDGVTLWRRSAGGFVDHTGRVLSASALYDALTADPRFDRFVVQERLMNHAALAALSGSPYLQTVRVVTLVDAAGAAHVLWGRLKLIVGENVADNFHFGQSGNLIVCVDPETGVVGSALTLREDKTGPALVPAHPRTGKAIAGFRLPFWEEVSRLARRCAALVLPMRTIGWDVAVTPSGPVIVEGNRQWDPINVFLLGPATPADAIARQRAFMDLLRREARACPR